MNSPLLPNQLIVAEVGCIFDFVNPNGCATGNESKAETFVEIEKGVRIVAGNSATALRTS